MAAFVGRFEELEKLDEVLTGNIRNCYIEAGPRSGSTALVKRFCEKSRCIHTTFHEGTDADCIQSFRKAIEYFTNESISNDADSFADLFHILSRVAREFEPILVFDKTQYAPEEFAKQVKWFSENEDVMIILIGYRDVKDYDITFSERFTLEEMTPDECMLLHPKMSRLDSLRTYMAVGGLPAYHALINKSDFATGVEKAFMGNMPKLLMEAELILRRSAVPYIMCCAILSDISNCIGRPVDIAKKEGISRQLCDIYLKKLTEEELVCTLVPVGNAPKKPVYIVKNPLIAFYFIAIRHNPDIEFSDKAGYRDIERYVDMFMELRFRDICELYLRSHYRCDTVGRWWLKEENTSQPTMVAIADIDGNKTALVADCKFRDGKIDQGALKAFVARSELIEDVPAKRLIMFSISGFDDKLVKKAKSEGVTLVGPSELGISDR